MAMSSDEDQDQPKGNGKAEVEDKRRGDKSTKDRTRRSDQNIGPDTRQRLIIKQSKSFVPTIIENSETVKFVLDIKFYRDSSWQLLGV